MSPTQANSQQALPASSLSPPPPLPSLECDESDDNNQGMEYEIKKFPLFHNSPPNDNKEEGDNHSEKVKLIVSEIKKLINQQQEQQRMKPNCGLECSLSNFNYVRSYKRVWFEGELSEKYNVLTGLTSLSSTKSEDSLRDTYLCVEREKYDYVTLNSWLEDRKDCGLITRQVLHFIHQLASTLRFMIESDIQIKKEGLSVSDIHVVFSDQGGPSSLVSQFTPNSTFFPNLKLSSLFQFEAILESLSINQFQLPVPAVIEDLPPKSQPEIQPEKNLAQFMEKIFFQLRQHHQVSSDQETSALSKLFEELTSNFQQSTDLLSSNLKTLLNKLSFTTDFCSTSFIFNLAQPTRHLFGRDAEIKNLLAITTESTRNKIIVIHGPNGIGKSELVNQLCGKLMACASTPTVPEADEPASLKHNHRNFIYLNAASPDTLTASLYNCVNYKKLNISTVDYLKQPRLLKDIFLELLVCFSEKDLLIVFDNLDSLAVETLDLIETFKDNNNGSFSSSTDHHHHLILITKQLWNNCPLLEDSDCTTLSLAPLNSEECMQLLWSKFNENDRVDLDKLLSTRLIQGYPAALRITLSYLTINPSYSANLLEDYPKIQDSDPICFAYQCSLSQLYKSLENDLQKCILGKLLYMLQFTDGHCGIHVTTLVEILNQLPSSSSPSPLQQQQQQLCLQPPESSEPMLLSLLSCLKKLSLIENIDGVIRLSTWMQISLRSSLETLSRNENPIFCDIDPTTILSTYYIVLSSKSAESDCWKLIGHASKCWKMLAKNNADICKRFDTLPELIAKLTKSFNKLELITDFLKNSIDIFTTCFRSSSADIHVLKLKYLLTVDSLLPKGLINEAFLNFKSIQDNCSTEPRDYLMIKLRSLIELGKIHMIRQHYDKAISCFQHVHVFASQKISILQQDSEPVVLCARLKHGQAHLQQGNLVESKKIILQVIPLLERYQGPEQESVRILVQDGKFHLGVLLRKNGDLVNALMLQTKVLEEREHLFGDKHPDTWASRVEMSLLYSSYDNHEKALVILRNLLEIQDEVLGAPSNRHSLATMNCIAEIESKLGNFDDALELYEAIDLIETQVLAENDQMRISSQLNQADVLMSLGQYKEAIDIYDLVYTLLSSGGGGGASGQQNDSVLLLCQNILGKRAKAERSMEILGNYWLSLTPENVDDPGELAALAKKHDVASQLTENLDNQGALRFLREILEDCGDSLEATNRFHLNVKADLARVLGLVGKFNESFSVYKEIIPVMDATFGETDELTMLCKDTMGQVFLFSGNQFLKRQMSNLKWFLL